MANDTSKRCFREPSFAKVSRVDSAHRELMPRGAGRFDTTAVCAIFNILPVGMHGTGRSGVLVVWLVRGPSLGVAAVVENERNIDGPEVL